MNGFNLVRAFGLATLLAAPAIAQAPAGGPPTVPGVSAQGNAVIAKIQKQTQADPTLATLAQKLRAIVPQISQTALAPTVDVEKFGSLLKQQQVLTQQLETKRTDMMIAILRQLPAADRGPFLKAIANKVPTQGAAPQGR